MPPATKVPVGLRHCRTTIKGSPGLCSSSPSLASFSWESGALACPGLAAELLLACPIICLPLPCVQVKLQHPDMSCCNPCMPCQPCGPTPLASSCNECCVRQCQSSTIAIQPSAVVVTLPGPILSSFPQNTVVGSSTSAAVGSILSCEGVPINSGGFDLSCITNRSCGTRCRPC
ncbi:feather keratin Cos1-2-like isoform X1 [Melopsittacus undulatus]|uniref:feather keratin Cos1-2-like isoform X1 n=1 Tax=Melopsittacus undulatus TaxID=13146 RepID=UPI00146AFA5D|nr:feather keratin Cos1-2-like isoform X1 [Melopsittacus undulatus]